MAAVMAGSIGIGMIGCVANQSNVDTESKTVQKSKASSEKKASTNEKTTDSDKDSKKTADAENQDTSDNKKKRSTETIMTTMEWLKTDRLPLDIKILATMVNRNKLEKTWIETLSELFGDRMFQTTIRYQAKPVEEASLKKSILLEDMTSCVAQDYQALVDELVD